MHDAATSAQDKVEEKLDDFEKGKETTLRLLSRIRSKDSMT